MYDYSKRTVITVGQRVPMELPYSEACMSMQVAGKVLEVELQHHNSYNPVAQLFKDGKEYSFPILTGEAGIYQDGGEYYYYPPKETNE